MSDEIDYETRKVSLLPLKTPLTVDDMVIIVGDTTPPDGYLGSVDELARLAGSFAPRGPLGPTGIQGPQGPPGAALNVDGSVPTVPDLELLTVDPGSVYVVAADGSVWVFDGTDWIEMQSVTGPQGPIGPPGSTGPQGIQGIQGMTGPAGTAGLNVPVATVLDYAGTDAPAGFVLCDGTYYDPALPLYQPLFNIIQYRFGNDGAGKFRVPPMNGRVAVGRNPVDSNIGTLGATNPMSAANAVIVNHVHAPGGLMIPNHRHRMDHGHINSRAEAELQVGMYLKLINGDDQVGAALYVQGRNNAAFQPPRRGLVGLWFAPLAEGAWEFRYAQRYTNGDWGIPIDGGTPHIHSVTVGSSTREYSDYMAEARPITEGKTADPDNGQSGVNQNYPPFMVLNKIIKL